MKLGKLFGLSKKKSYNRDSYSSDRNDNDYKEYYDDDDDDDGDEYLDRYTAEEIWLGSGKDEDYLFGYSESDFDD